MTSLAQNHITDGGASSGGLRRMGFVASRCTRRVPPRLHFFVQAKYCSWGGGLGRQPQADSSLAGRRSWRAAPSPVTLFRADATRFHVGKWRCSVHFPYFLSEHADNPCASSHFLCMRLPYFLCDNAGTPHVSLSLCKNADTHMCVSILLRDNTYIPHAFHTFRSNMQTLLTFVVLSVRKCRHSTHFPYFLCEILTIHKPHVFHPLCNNRRPSVNFPYLLRGNADTSHMLNTF